MSVVDFTLYPEVTLALRIARRKPGLVVADLIGPKMTAWTRRMEALAAQGFRKDGIGAACREKFGKAAAQRVDARPKHAPQRVAA